MSNKYFKKTLTEIFADLPYRCIEHSKIHGNYLNTVIDRWPSGSIVLSAKGFADTFYEAMHKKNAGYRTNTRIYNTKPVKSKNGSKRFTYPPERVTISDYQIMIQCEDNIHVQTPKPSNPHPVRSTLHLFY